MTKTTKTAPVQTKPTTTQAASTKDSGAVHVGGSFIRFSSTKDAGKVHVGGSFIRF